MSSCATDNSNEYFSIDGLNVNYSKDRKCNEHAREHEENPLGVLSPSDDISKSTNSLLIKKRRKHTHTKRINWNEYYSMFDQVLLDQYFRQSLKGNPDWLMLSDVSSSYQNNLQKETSR